jgi:GNAT superfamily N-acetyltransferase
MIASDATGGGVGCRAATEVDRGLLTRLVTEYYEHDDHEIDLAVISSAIDAAVGGDIRMHLVIVEVDGEPVGYMALSTGFSMESGGPDGCIDELYLVESMRGRGLGSRMLAHADEVFSGLGVRRIYLEVEKHNPRARSLYADSGYAETDRHLMTKWLNRPGP